MEEHSYFMRNIDTIKVFLFANMYILSLSIPLWLIDWQRKWAWIKFEFAVPKQSQQVPNSGGLWYKIVLVEFVQVGDFDAKSYKLNFMRLLKMRTSEICTSWDCTSGGNPVIVPLTLFLPIQCLAVYGSTKGSRLMWSLGLAKKNALVGLPGISQEAHAQNQNKHYKHMSTSLFLFPKLIIILFYSNKSKQIFKHVPTTINTSNISKLIQ